VVVLVMADDEEVGGRIKKTPYVRLYSGFYLDSKVQAVSTEAELLYVRALGWSKAENLDGAVPETALASLCFKFNMPPSVLSGELVQVGLWTPDDPGVSGVTRERWRDYQWTVARTEKRRANNRERQDRRRHPERYAETNGHVQEEDDEPSRRDDAVEPPPGDVGSAPA
jgi:hypothetical protein